MEQFWSLLEDGTIQPIIDSVYPIEQANQAHAHMAANKNIGDAFLLVWKFLDEDVGYNEDTDEVFLFESFRIN